MGDLGDLGAGPPPEVEDSELLPEPKFELDSNVKLKGKPLEPRSIIRPVARKFVDGEWRYMFLMGFGYRYTLSESELEEVNLSAGDS